MSEPKIIVLGGNSGRWHARERAADAATTNGIEAWVHAFDGNYIEGNAATSKDIDPFDIIIANYKFPQTLHLLELARNRNKACKFVLLIEGDALYYVKPRPYLRDLLDNSDLVVCINKHTDQFFKHCTSTRVEHIGIPYPAQGIRTFATPIEKRRKEIFLAPLLLSRWLEYYCVKDLGIPMYGYEKRLSRRWGTIAHAIRTHRSINPHYFHNKVRQVYNDPSLTIYRESSLSEFFQHNGGASVWLNLDPRYTWGRYVLDAAALQVPIVTTRSTGHGDHFFPLTTVENEFETEKALNLVKKLLTDEEFYREVATVPIELFDDLRPEVMKQKLLQALFS